MDYVTRQLFVLSKKLREWQSALHNQLAILSNDLKDLKNAVAENRQSDYQRREINGRITVAYPDTKVPIRVHAETQRTKIENIWRYVKGTAELVGIVAVIIYTIVSYFNWREQTDATNYAGIQARKARETLNETIKNFRLDERAWIVIEPVKPNRRLTAFAQQKVFRYELYPRNVGKTVATGIIAKAQASSGGESIGQSPQVISNIQDRELLNKFRNNGGGPAIIPQSPMPKVLAPGTSSTVPLSFDGREPITNPQWVRDRHELSYIIGRIDYCDEFRIRHWVKFCFFVANSDGDLANCQTGNDADRNPEIGDENSRCSVTLPKV
jgi:hypothetical protein